MSRLSAFKEARAHLFQGLLVLEDSRELLRKAEVVDLVNEYQTLYDRHTQLKSKYQGGLGRRLLAQVRTSEEILEHRLECMSFERLVTNVVQQAKAQDAIEWEKAESGMFHMDGAWILRKDYCITILSTDSDDDEDSWSTASIDTYPP
ncbi:hypothetical protein OE88DRAFT_1655626 [Heliocybe sulcata]|uniref:Uncharacterized protein n=1 Tax=Heliocybe sulcata TaxID=5364 RepID=A0A5C3N831_9AGAM|nr:hypothetical protein OE88DRAFT_1655626 [Heliocybe sulcata]